MSFTVARTSGILLFVACSCAQGQAIVPDTLRRFSEGDSGNVYPISIRQTSSGNISVLGYRQLFYPYRKFTWLSQFSPSGKLISMGNIDSSGFHGLDVLDMEVLDSSRLVLCGIKADSLWVSMVDTAGTFIWSASYLDSASFGDMTAGDSNSILVTGSLHDSVFLAKMSPEGILKWVKNYPKEGHTFIKGTSIVQRPNGQIIVGADFTDWAGDYGISRVGIYLLDSSGDFESSHLYFSNTETVQRLGLSRGGDIVMLCNVAPGSHGYDDAALRVISRNGDEVWYHQYGSYHMDNAYDMCSDTAGNIYVCGYTEGFGIPDNRDYWVFRCDSAGNLVWNFWMGTDLWESATSVITSHGNVFFLGSSFTLGGFGGGGKTVLVRLADHLSGVFGERTLSSNRLSVSAYPNPGNGSTTIQLVVSSILHVKLELYDVLGRRRVLLADDEVGPGQHRIPFDAANLASGMYILRVEAGNEVLAAKLLIAK